MQKSTTPEPRGTLGAPGNLSMPTLALATAVSIAVVGAVFFWARSHLPKALALDPVDQARVAADPEIESAATPTPTSPSRAEPGQAVVRQVDPQWNLPKVQQAIKAGGEALEGLVPHARAELAELGRLDDPDPVRSARAERQFDSWGHTWINRLRTIAKGLPTQEQCDVHVSMSVKCRALRLALAEAAHAAKEAGLDGARDRLDGTATRVGEMLRPSALADEDDEASADRTEAVRVE